MRHTKGHTGNRRSHHATKEPRLAKCEKCGELHISHTMCANCGTYNGRQVVDVMAKLVKKAEKIKKAKEMKTGVEEKKEKTVKKVKTVKKEKKEVKEKKEAKPKKAKAK